jgi:hypothetical protein
MVSTPRIPTPVSNTPPSFIDEAQARANSTANFLINGVPSQGGITVDSAHNTQPATIDTDTGTAINPNQAEANLINNALNPAPPGAAPAADPAPSLLDPSPQETAAQKLRRLAALRMGLAKTIKTTPMGVVDSPLVSAPAAYAPGLKGKLGQ